MSEKQTTRIQAKTKYQITGWILFIICAIFFMAASLVNHDMLTLFGSVIFLIACFVFLVPIIAECRATRDDKNESL